MYYIHTPNTIKPEDEQKCYIDGELALVNWRGDALLVNNEQHCILHSHIEGNSRIFTCASPPRDEPVECEHCEDPNKNGVHPSEPGPSGGLIHRVKHIITGAATCIPCRKSAASIVVSRRTWSDNYKKTAPAGVSK